MASKNKSENLKLNLWAETDRPQRTDFNNDNMIIDETLGSHIDNDRLHLTDAEKERVSAPVVTTGYQGNGLAERQITLPQSGQTVMVYCAGMPFCGYDKDKDCAKTYMAFCSAEAGGSAGVSISGKVLTVMQQSTAENGAVCCLNEEGRQYRVVIFR